MVSWQDIHKLNQKDIAFITRFVDTIRRTKGNYNEEQQALIQLTDQNLSRIVRAYQVFNAPPSTEATITKLTDKTLQRARTSLLALETEVEDNELKERINIILAILGKLG